MTSEPSDLRGEVIDPVLAPPIFAVENQAFEQRTEAFLVGQPSVVWFFRDAAEAG